MRLRLSPLLVPCLALATLTATAPLAAQEHLTEPSAGFAIDFDAADQGWIHRAQRDGERLTVWGAGPPALGGLVELSIQVSSASESGAEASRTALDALLAQVEAVPGIEIQQRLERELGGSTAYGVQLEQQAQGQLFQVQLFLLLARGFQYRVQFHAPAEAFEEHWPIAVRLLDSFTLIDADATTAQRHKLLALAAKCGSQIDWASDWEAAAARAQEQQRLIAVAIHSIPGFSLGDPLMQGPFMDDEVIALMQACYVGLIWKQGMPAPFVDPSVFGLGGSTFGSGVLIVTPEGKVVRQLYLMNGELTAAALREVQNGHPGLGGPSGPFEPSPPAQWAETYLDQGALDAARRELGPAPGSGAEGAPVREPAELALQRARLARIERSGLAALRALDYSEPTPSVPLRSRLTLERARIHIGMGDLAAARELLEDTPIENFPTALAAEAELALATLEWAAGERDAAVTRLERLCQERPTAPAAWQAAAALTGPALQLEVTPRLSWLDDYAYQAARIAPPAPPTEALEPAAAAEAAVRWLVAAQERDGSWRTPSGIGDTQEAPDPITMASQAIAIQALLAYAAAPQAEATLAQTAKQAALRGLNRYLDLRLLVREHPREVAFMDYTCWSASYGIFLLDAVERHFRAGEINPSRHALGRADQELRALAADLLRIQQPNFGWSYYLSGEVNGEATVAAMSFTTATVLQALELARAHEVELDAERVARGYRCLEVMRGSNGAFEYLRMGGSLEPPGAVEVRGGAARGPHCTALLIQGGLVEPSELVGAFARYIEHLPSFGDQSRRALMHCGPQTQGSHYLCYDYANAAAVLRAAPADALDAGLRRQVRAATLRELARCRSADGSFVDNPIVGPVAATGLAIQALLDLQ